MPRARKSVPETLPKTASGIAGLDEITRGGLPRGRTTLVVGGPGCGKTLLGIEFLVRGALDFNEPGAFVAFEETPEELSENVRSLGYDLDALVASKKLVLDYVRVERSEIEETGDYDLEGLFVRLAHAIDSIGAKRLVIDTLEVLFSGLKDHGVLRAELRRLFRWLKDRQVTAIVTAERGPEGGLSRHGIEEYVSDCVIALDHRVTQQISTRRLRVVKYRGTSHGANEYPFLIDEGGLVVFPITSLGLDYPASSGHLSTGVKGLDEALDGRGFLRGSSVLVTGTAGTGKTSIAAGFVNAACARGERCLYFAMEESPDQIVRNMSSLGMNLERWRKRGLLRLQSARPTLHGLETHLAILYKAVAEFEPRIVVMDPLTNLGAVGSDREITAVITRLLDFLKSRQITGLFTTLASIHADPEHSEVGVSSWMDTWLLLRTLESAGTRRRTLYVTKSRGMPHSDSIHELKFTSRGMQVKSAAGVPA
jgi:circadian clock protein KaiC